jgi:hypothetical protein
MLRPAVAAGVLLLPGIQLLTAAVQRRHLCGSSSRSQAWCLHGRWSSAVLHAGQLQFLAVEHNTGFLLCGLFQHGALVSVSSCCNA